MHVLEPGQLNTYDVLISDDVIFTLGALDAFLAGPATGKSAKGAASSAELADDADRTDTDEAVTDEDAELMFDDHRDVLLAPVISEKSYGLLDENKYTFDVHPDANKTQIKIAVEKVFNVKVTDVNTLNRQGKRKRTRFGYGTRKSIKRAVVTLREGDRIEVFGGPAA